MTEFDSHLPIYLQLAERIKSEIIQGRYAKGEKIPSVRECALRYKVNPNTAVKALGCLEQEGLIYTKRGSGKYVSLDNQALEKSRLEKAEKLVKACSDSLKELGFEEKEIRKLFERIFT